MKNFTVTTPKSVKLDKKRIHSIVSELKKILPFTVESLQINFVQPDLMIEINKQYLNHNYDTDIIKQIVGKINLHKVKQSELKAHHHPAQEFQLEIPQLIVQSYPEYPHQKN